MCSVEDLYTARALLDSVGMSQTKIIAKVGRQLGGNMQSVHSRNTMHSMHAALGYRSSSRLAGGSLRPASVRAASIPMSPRISLQPALVLHRLPRSSARRPSATLRALPTWRTASSSPAATWGWTLRPR